MSNITRAGPARNSAPLCPRGQPSGLKFAADDVSWPAIANLMRASIDLHARCAAKSVARADREAAA